MRKSLLILLCLSMSYFLMAEETVKQKEIGLVSSNFDDFGLTFKTGTGKALWRFNTLIFSGSNSENINSGFFTTQSALNFGAKVGREYRRYLTDNLELRYGADISFSYSHSKNESDQNNALAKINLYSPGVNLVFGFNYILNDNFLIGVELLPYINYTNTVSTQSNSSNEQKIETSAFNYGLSNKSVLFSLAYRF